MSTMWTSRGFLVSVVVVGVTLTGGAQERERSSIAERYTWNLSEIYATPAAWRTAKEKLTAEIPQLARSRGTLGSSATALADTLEKMSALDKELSRLYVYASMLADQDTRDATYQGMEQEMVQLASAFSAAASHIEPEVLRLPAGAVDGFLRAEPRLAVYRFYLEGITRRAAHTLTDTEEKILADVGPLAGSASSIYNILANADFPYPTVTLADGSSLKVGQAGYGVVRASANRQDRQTGMAAFFGALGSFRGTLGTIMSASLQKALFLSKTRKYESSLDAALYGPNIPVSVYTSLVNGVNANLPAFHRYLRLRKRMMGVSELHYYDLYAPLVESANTRFTPEEAQALVVAAMAPLGRDYQGVLTRAFNERWIDLFPSPGKRSGAYSNGGAYDVHPYMLINYNARYDDVSTLAHELGHTMQSYYSNKTQPYPLASYPTFVAEVASTFNESLLIDHMLKTVKDDGVRLSLLGNYLENIKGTVFRQTQFAEFEMRMHDMAQRGQPVTGDSLAALYLDITKRYYGHDQGVCVVDDYVAHEWSFIPHFYRDFYVFQYATSFTASEALAAPVKAGDAAATQKYLRFISAGGSKYPIDLLKDAGVDMTTGAPLALTITEMNRVMDEMEKLLAKRPVSAGR